jgi:AraC-like DNA-binding protein
MEHAKTLLAKPGSSIVDIAFSVGFQTQSHFTTVFKRLEGITPNRWRELHGEEASGLTAIIKHDGRGAARPGL